jgi:hypothetical protein
MLKPIVRYNKEIILNSLQTLSDALVTHSDRRLNKNSTKSKNLKGREHLIELDQGGRII